MRSSLLKRSTPRWMIFAAEQVSILLAFILSFWIIRHLQPGVLTLPLFKGALWVNLSISISLAFYFETYTGMVSQTGIRDIRKVILFSFCHMMCWLLLLVIGWHDVLPAELIIGFPIVNASLISVLITGLRLLVKEIYSRGQEPEHSWKRRMFHVDELTDLAIASLLERDEVNFRQELTISYFSRSVVLVTGAAGSIGSEICRQLSWYAIRRIILLDQSESGLFDLAFELKNRNGQADICMEVASVRDAKRIEELFDRYKPNYVFHAAAYKHVPIMEFVPSEAILTNVMGTQILAEAAIRHEANKFILISSDKAVHPANMMGATKCIAEMYIHSLSGRTGQTQFTTTRFGNVLGSTGSVIPLFIKQILRGGPITITHPDITRYFMTIPEAGRLVVEACVMGKGSEIFVFNMGEPVKILEVATKLIRLAGYTPGREIAIEFIGLRQGEKIHEELFSESEDLIPTYHPKIMRAKMREVDNLLFPGQLEKLVAYATEHRQTEARCLILTMLPEYHALVKHQEPKQRDTEYKTNP